MTTVKCVSGGWGQDFSATEAVLKKGVKWNNGGVVQQIGAHTVLPVALVGAAAIDLFAHAIQAVVKTALFAVNTVAVILTVNYIKFNAALTPDQLFKHVWKSAVAVVFAVLGSAAAIFSVSAAKSLAETLGLYAACIKKSFKERIWDDMPAGAFAKVSHVTRELAQGGVDATKCVARNVQFYAWTKWEGNATIRNVVYAMLPVIGYAYFVVQAYRNGGETASIVTSLYSPAVDGAKSAYATASGAAASSWEGLKAAPTAAWEGLKAAPAAAYTYAKAGVCAIPGVNYFCAVDLKAAAKAAKAAEKAACDAAKEAAAKAAATGATPADIAAATDANTACGAAKEAAAAAAKAVKDAAEAAAAAKAAADATAKAAADATAKAAADAATKAAAGAAAGAKRDVATQLE